MAHEIKLNWDDVFLEADMSYLDGDLESEPGFASAVIISLFTDAKAKRDDILPDETSADRRGWWGDLASPVVQGDRIGSRLWLLERSKTIPSVLFEARQYAEESLQWMIDDGIASEIEVETERQGTIGNDRLALGIKIHLISGTTVSIFYNDGTITIEGVDFLSSTSIAVSYQPQSIDWG